MASKTPTSTQKKKARLLNTAILLGALVAVIVLVNVVSVRLSGRIDLTENQVNVLSEESIEALNELLALSDSDRLEVRLFISDPLPDRIPGSMNDELVLLGVPQKLRDKVQEFAELAGARIHVVAVTDDVENQARKAGLVPFQGEEARIKDYELERAEYFVGATFEYKGQKEILVQALKPAEFEYEITRRLLRLKDRVEGARKVVHLSRETEALMGLLEKCDAEFHRFEPETDKESEAGIGGIVEAIRNTDDEARKLAENHAFIMQQCAPLVEQVTAVKGKFAGDNRRFDEFLAGLVNPDVLQLDDAEFEEARVGGLLAYTRLLKRFNDVASAGTPDTGAVLSVKQELTQVKDNVETLKEAFDKAPGERQLGFVCGHGEFCPFRSDKMIVNPQIAQMMAQQNPQQAQVLQVWSQIQQQINHMLETTGRRNFIGEDFAIDKLDATQPIPDEYAAIMVYAPKDTIPDIELYHLDQYLLGGGTVIVAVDNYDVALQSFSEEKVKEMNPFDRNTPQPKPEFNSISPWFHNLNQWLGKYGIEIQDNLVADGTRNGQVFLMYTDPHTQIRYNKKFNYPLVPATENLHRSHPLVRTLEQAVMPFVSSIEVSEVEGQDVTVTPLIQSGPESVVLDLQKGEDPGKGKAPGTMEVPFPLEPEELMTYVEEAEKTGEQVLAVEVTGEFKSAFDARPEENNEASDESEKTEEDNLDKKEPEHRSSGSGRLLVMGTGLGIPPVSVETIFKGLQPFSVQPTSGEAILPEMRMINAMQLKNTRHRPFLPETGPMFMQTLRWGAQPEALSQVEAKHNEFRPIETFEEDQQKQLVWLYVGVFPLIVILAGFAGWFFRTRRQRTLSKRVTSSTPQKTGSE